MGWVWPRLIGLPLDFQSWIDPSPAPIVNEFENSDDSLSALVLFRALPLTKIEIPFGAVVSGPGSVFGVEGGAGFEDGGAGLV